MVKMMQCPDCKGADMQTYNPKEYFSKDAMLEQGRDLTEEQMSGLRQGEVFTLLDEEGKPCSLVLMDSYNQIREGAISQEAVNESTARENIQR